MAQSAATAGSGAPEPVLYEGLPPPVHGPAPAPAAADAIDGELVDEAIVDEAGLDAAAAAAAAAEASDADPSDAASEDQDTAVAFGPVPPPVAPPMAMDQRLANRLAQFNTLITQDMITALVANNCLTEEDYLDAATTVDDARKSFTLLAKLKLVTATDVPAPPANAIGEVHASHKMALGKLVRIWNDIKVGVATSEDTQVTLGGTIKTQISQSSMKHLRTIRAPYYTADEKTTATVYQSLQSGKFDVHDLSTVRCKQGDDRIPLNTGPKATPAMVVSGYDQNGNPVLVPKQEMQNYWKWKRQHMLYYKCWQDCGNQVFPWKRKKKDHPEFGKPYKGADADTEVDVAWWGNSVYEAIFARFDQFVHDADLHHRVD